MGFNKVPLFLKLLFSTLQEFGRLVLWEAVFILELHSAETQAKSATTSSTGGLILALKRAFLLLAQKGGIASAFTGPL